MARKVRTVIVAAALAVLMAVAAVPGNAQTEITFAWTGPNPGWERTIENFNASQNEVKVTRRVH